MTADTPSFHPSADSSAFDRFARFYDDDYRHYAADLDCLTTIAQESGGPILELGCGTGRALLPIAQNGLSVTGIDISPALLEIARHKVAVASLDGRVELVQGDMRTLSLPRTDYVFAYCTSNTLMHLTTPADQLQVLRRACDHLCRDGLFLIDLFNPDVVRLNAVNGLQELADRWEDPIRGTQVLKWSIRWIDWAAQIQETLFVYEEIGPDGSVRHTPCPFSLRFLWRNEAELMLSVAGFAVDEVWGDFDGSDYEQDSNHLIILARKK